jgi:biopolymer transport protein ExbB/TolQ
MDLIIQALYWISSGLLIPTIVLLLLFLAQGLFVVGGFYGLYAHRMAYEKSVKPALDDLEADNAQQVLAPDHIRKTGLVNIYLEQLLAAAHNPVKAEKVLADFEMACEKDLAMVKTLAKIGPILGLMGTLIPMGPALVGLASGWWGWRPATWPPWPRTCRWLSPPRWWACWWGRSGFSAIRSRSAGTLRTCPTWNTFTRW